MTTNSNPEVGLSIAAAGIRTNYHDLNSSAPGVPLLLIHGSGPGVSAFANWRLVMPKFAETRRVIAPDMVGFGFTDRPVDHQYTLDHWVSHAIGLLDALALAQVDLVGNSFGGALSLALAIRHPQRVRRLVLMGAAGVHFELTPALDAVWGYQPSFESMRRMMDLFAYDRSLVNDELAQLRYQASIRPGFQESFSAMFPVPRQRSIDALASAEADISQLAHQTLVIHGREDQVIPLATSLKLAQLIPNAQLHVFGKCGHWTQIEHSARFARLVTDFLQEAA
ncbi:alpha/beta fold hydrolase [uncultured Nevskia sp.]|uniref:alpha/beta fold hydrolase n=1 Tax=uncultured Nevskia sp. TaxID=228950 RepID=UPI0025ED717E|nr:alpha/beta fold hydrolase [uncultured Nevskia sp.]